MTDEEKAAAELAAENSNDPTEINEEELLAAVSDAVDEETPGLEKKDDEEADDGADDDAELDGDEELDPDSESGTDDKDGDQEGETEGKPEDKEGDKPEEDGEDDGGDATKKADDKAGDKPKPGDDDAADLDHVNDPIPEATNEKTAARIKGLIGLVKDGNAATSQRDEIIEQITATGADSEQYAATLGFLKLFNSADVKDRKTALEVARGMVKELALDVGEGASVTKLEDHDDLQAEVEAGTLTEPRALEIAATRDRQKLLDSRKEVADNKTDTANETAENVKAGQAQLDTLETSLRGSVKNYDALRPAFIAMLRPVLKRVHPTEYAAVAKEVFEQVQKANPNAGAKPKPKVAPKETPLRPGQRAGGGNDKKVEGGDVMDAMNAAIENAY